jgi:Domain of unknown function (DUF4279)
MSLLVSWHPLSRSSKLVVRALVNASALHGARHDTRRVETKATFRVEGDGAILTASRVTDKLGLRPTSSYEAGTPVSSRSTSKRPTSMWLLSSSPTIERGVELADQLERLLTKLEPVSGTLWELVRAGYQANWLCYVASHPTEHAAELSRPLLTRLLGLPGDLWLDVCGDDDDG